MHEDQNEKRIMEPETGLKNKTVKRRLAEGKRNTEQIEKAGEEGEEKNDIRMSSNE